jgi:hypothetical protein
MQPPKTDKSDWHVIIGNKSVKCHKRKEIKEKGTIVLNNKRKTYKIHVFYTNYANTKTGAFENTVTHHASYLCCGQQKEHQNCTKVTKKI